MKGLSVHALEAGEDLRVVRKDVPGGTWRFMGSYK